MKQTTSNKWISSRSWRNAIERSIFIFWVCTYLFKGGRVIRRSTSQLPVIEEPRGSRWRTLWRPWSAIPIKQSYIMFLFRQMQSRLASRNARRRKFALYLEYSRNNSDLRPTNLYFLRGESQRVLPFSFLVPRDAVSRHLISKVLWKLLVAIFSLISLILCQIYWFITAITSNRKWQFLWTAFLHVSFVHPILFHINALEYYLYNILCFMLYSNIVLNTVRKNTLFHTTCTFYN